MSSREALSDQRARDRIVSELRRNVLVEAGAGSGKTHEMAARMAAGVASGEYQVDGMAAVTFTRKAAAELRGRFQQALEAELAAGPRDSHRTARIRAALSNLERFFAGTIHSFCAHLLRERPVEAGVSPGFSELDELGDAFLRGQSWRDFVSQKIGAGDPEILALQDAGVDPAGLDDAFKVVTLYEEVEFPAGAAPKPDFEPAWTALQAFWAALEKELPRTIRPGTTCPTQVRALRFTGQRRVARKDRRWHATVAAMLETWDAAPKITQYLWADTPAEKRRINRDVCALLEDVRGSVVIPALTAWREYVYGLAIPLLAEAREFAASERRRLNVMNYGDLLQLAARVLRENVDVRRALQEKYRWIFVDEFQDTDPVQAEIIVLLASDTGVEAGVKSREGAGVARPVSDWRALPLRPGALFVVGDPKQSIYRFRRADIDIYNIVRERLADPVTGDVLFLTTNFRSVPALCEWANDVFRRSFPAAATKYSPPFAALEPARPSRRPRNGPPAVFTLDVPGECKAAEVCAAEAGCIAGYIRAEVDAGRRAFGDFLILTRKKKSLSTYAEALEDLQVPIEVSGAGAFAKSKEVAHLARLLRALSDPQDAVSLVGVLRGPLFGLSDPDLFAWRQAGGWFSIFAGGEGTDGPPPGSTGDALRALRQYYHWTRVLPAGAALERILEDTGYLALAATSPGGVEAGDLLHALDRVRLAVGEGATLADAADALDEDLEAASEVESLPLEPGRADAVRLMNLHKAKGLEAPVVFLADPCGTYDPPVDVRILRDGSVARGYFRITRKWGDGGGRAQVIGLPTGWAAHEEEEKRYLDAEQVRLLYVAATRAREMLVVGRWDRDAGARPRAWDALDPFLADAPRLSVPRKLPAPAPQKVDLSPEARAAAGQARADALARARAASWTVTSVTADARHIAKMTRRLDPLPEDSDRPAAAKDSIEDDPTRVVVRDTPSHRADAGAAWGTLIHGLLEHAMRHEHATRDDLRRLALWLTVEEPQLRAVLDEAIDTVQAVARAEFWKTAKAGEHRVETPFGFADGERTVMMGVIDLLFHGQGRWNIIDYKTDVDADARATVYRTQLAHYQHALESIGLDAGAASVVGVRISGDADPGPRAGD